MRVSALSRTTVLTPITYRVSYILYFGVMTDSHENWRMEHFASFWDFSANSFSFFLYPWKKNSSPILKENHPSAAGSRVDSRIWKAITCCESTCFSRAHPQGKTSPRKRKEAYPGAFKLFSRNDGYRESVNPEQNTSDSRTQMSSYWDGQE